MRSKKNVNKNSRIVKKDKEEVNDTEARESIKKMLLDINEIIKEYNIPEDTSNVRAVLEKIRERLEYYIKILIQVLQPEDFHSLHECNIFTDSEKSKIFNIYKDLMILHREIIKSEIQNEEKNIIATINYSHSEIKRFKPEIIKIIEKMQESWKRTGNNGRVRYFG
ncbi:MAG: hypothetical protein KatS3mg002_0515 [Candidatus Woesearchaeota archaeon]|nr:MAG: hypothetical protein KatS3mg002_0515 [Candidatus Woesearchaeota archaeon]